MPRAAHYLKLIDKNGNMVEGESEGNGFERQIDITDWSWGVTDQAASGSSATGTGTGTGTGGSATPTSGRSGAASSSAGGVSGSGGGESGGDVSLDTFGFSKPVDKSTIRLMQAMHNGDELTSARITLMQELPGAERPRIDEFLLYVDLTKVRIKSYNLKGNSEEFGVTLEESWEMSYKTIKFIYETRGVEIELENKDPSTSRPTARTPPDPNARIAELERRLAAATGGRRGSGG